MVKCKFLIFIMVAFLLAPVLTIAMTVVECVNKRGESTFAERCPPGSTIKSKKQLRGLSNSKDDGETAIAAIARAHPVTLFAIQEGCEACGLVKSQLQARAIPFNEIDVTGDREKFKQLTEVTGGVATVPTLTIDDKVLSGHNAALLDAALDDAGYPN